MRLMEIQRAWVASSIVNSLRRGSRNYDCRTILLGSWRDKEKFYVGDYTRYQAQRTTQTRWTAGSGYGCECGCHQMPYHSRWQQVGFWEAKCLRVRYARHMEPASTGTQIGKQVDWCAWRAWKPARCSDIYRAL
jgi:hypothetical protein